MMKKYYSLIFILLLISESKATTKDAIIENLKEIKNLEFNFEQNIKGKIERGNCILQYPKKIYCKYDLRNQKILVSNGKSLVIKTLTSYYYYPLERTPLNHILNKDFLLKFSYVQWVKYAIPNAIGLPIINVVIASLVVVLFPDTFVVVVELLFE